MEDGGLETPDLAHAVMNTATVLREVERTVHDLDEAELQAELEALATASPYYEANLFLYDAGRFACIDLNKIRVRRDAPPGTGTDFIEKLQAIAKRYGRYITLTPGSHDDADRKDRVWKQTTSANRLKAWYSSLGFRRNASKGLFQLRGYFHWSPK